MRKFTSGCGAGFHGEQPVRSIQASRDVRRRPGIKAIQGATISPDGRSVIYGVREWVSEQDKMESRTHVWKVATDGNSPARQITFGEKGESQAQFSPDGKFISFVAARGSAEAKSQIHVMSIEGGEAWKLTDAKENVSSYSWSPDGSRIAFVVDRSSQRR